MADHVAVWRELARQLRTRIMAGELRPGDRLPSEEQLRQEYGVSRTNVRRAAAELRLEGLIVIRSPLGMFVTETRPAGGADQVRFVASPHQLTMKPAT